jgi:hypothetical protein
MERRKSRLSLPKPKGGGEASKKKLPSEVKTIAKTAARNIKKSQQKVAINKETASVQSPTLSNKGIDEGMASSISDLTEPSGPTIAPTKECN